MSALALGTVQLGMHYGIANTSGHPSDDQAHAILDEALRGGIEDIDTAQTYGSSESVIGSWAGRNHCRIVSKCSQESSESPDATLLRDLERSVASLRIQSLHGMLLHHSTMIFDESWISALSCAKRSGLVSKTGISVYTPEEALAAVMKPAIDIIQIPYNILDQRLDKTDFFTRAEGEGKEVWARSAFLQGLLLMPMDRIPKPLASVIPYRFRIDEFCQQHGFTLLEALLLYSLTKPGVNKTLIGVESLDQLQESLTIQRARDRFTTHREEFAILIGGDAPTDLVSPNKWHTQ